MIARELLDTFRQLDVEGGQAVSLIVRRERDRDAVVDVGPFWVVLHDSYKVNRSSTVLYSQTTRKMEREKEMTAQTHVEFLCPDGDPAHETPRLDKVLELVVPQ